MICRSQPTFEQLELRAQLFARDLVKARRIIFIGQGTALHAAMVGEYLIPCRWCVHVAETAQR